MSSDTLVKAPAAPDIPEDADSPRIVPQRRPGQWIAAARLSANPVPSVGQYYVERSSARGSEAAR